MKRNHAIFFYYNKPNRYSFNALIGAIENAPIYEEYDIFLIRTKNTLIQQLIDSRHKYKNIVVAISFFTTQLWETFDLIQTIRNGEFKNIFSISGGPHPTGEPLKTLQMGFDLVVIGEGEVTLIEILTKLVNNEDIYKLKGIGFLDDDHNYKFTGRREYIDLSDYPPFPVKLRSFGPIEITRGCPYLCYFCQTPFLLGNFPRHRSIKSIQKYVEILYKNALRDIRFITPNAFSYGSVDGKTINIDSLETMLKEVKKVIGSKGRIFFGSFPSEVRPEHVNQETLNLITNYCDNDNIIIGAQSGSNKMLEYCNRGHTIEDVYKAVQKTIKAKLLPNIDFIFGLPNETEEEINQTLKAIKDLTKMGARIHAHTFIPLPQTPFKLFPAGVVAKRLRQKIDALLQLNLIYGDWKKQEKIAKKISYFLKAKDLDGLYEK